MPSSLNMPATSPRWSKTWLRYVGWADITISSDEEEIVNDLQRNTKMMKSGERGAERRVKSQHIDIAGVILWPALLPHIVYPRISRGELPLILARWLFTTKSGGM